MACLPKTDGTPLAGICCEPTGNCPNKIEILSMIQGACSTESMSDDNIRAVHSRLRQEVDNITFGSSPNCVVMTAIEGGGTIEYRTTFLTQSNTLFFGSRSVGNCTDSVYAGDMVGITQTRGLVLHEIWKLRVRVYLNACGASSSTLVRSAQPNLFEDRSFPPVTVPKTLMTPGIYDLTPVCGTLLINTPNFRQVTNVAASIMEIRRTTEPFNC